MWGTPFILKGQKMRIQDYIAHLKKFTADAQDSLILKVIEENEPFLVDLNTAQLMRGRDSNGQIFGTYRSQQYADFKRYVNPIGGGNVDLRLTGRFHNSFYIEAKRFPVIFDARDYKTPRLTEKYGTQIFGLTKESKETAVEHIRGEVIDIYRRKIFLVR